MIEELRNFIRHPSAIPITFNLRGHESKKSLKDVGKGGLCFVSDQYLPVGEKIQIEISCCKPGFSAEGIVRWCKQDKNQFLIGVAFKDKAIQFAVRMVEQICHIEAYKQKVKAKTGKVLSSEEAAREWIQKNAEAFPKL